MTYLFTAVITTFNRPDYFSEALLSVLTQTHHAHQIVIVNDGSDAKYDREYNKLIANTDFANITYTKLPQKMGANFARNYAVKKASANVVAFLDDDDKWDRYFLVEHLRQYQNDEKTAAVLCGLRIMGQNVCKINRQRVLDEDSLKPGNRFCGMSGVSAKKEVLLTTPFDETLSNGQDWDLYVRLVQTSQKVRNIDKALFEYRKNSPNSISTVLKNMTIEQSEARLASAYKHRAWLGEAHFKYRVADQLLTFIQHRPDKIKWLSKSIKIAGWSMTFSILLNKLLRK